MHVSNIFVSASCNANNPIIINMLKRWGIDEVDSSGASMNRGSGK